MRRGITNSTGKRRRRIFILFFISCFSVFVSCFLPLKVSALIVSETEINGLASIEEEELLYLLDIKAGSPINGEHIRQGIKRAFLKGIFEDISVETVNGEKTKVIIQVREREFIEKVSVEGDTDLSRKFIKKAFLLKEEQTMRYDLIDAAAEQLKQEMAKRGFPHAGVNVKIEKSKKPYRVILFLQVNTGEPESIKKIIFTVESGEAKRLMSLSEEDRYDQEKVGKDIEKIKTFYRKDGYFKPSIGPHTFHDGVLNIPVHPGKRLIITLVGNSVVSNKNLLKEMMKA